MSSQIPKIDSRSAEEIAMEVKQLIGNADAENDPLGDALVRIFARYSEIIIERLNKVPEKNYLAFLNELGVSRNPPMAARVPLTFKPVKNAANVPVIVPQYTKVTAPPGDGENTPVVFETTRTLTLTQAELHKIVTLNTLEDKYTAHGLYSTEQDITGELLFKGTTPIKHEFFIAIHESIATDKKAGLHLFLSIEEQIAYPGNPFLEWKIENNQSSQIITPVKETTCNLRCSGEIVFEELPKWESSTKAGQNHYWLSCRLITSLKSRSYQSPVIQEIMTAASSMVQEAIIDFAFCNNALLDLSKDFFPLGKNPTFGDVLYLGCSSFIQPEANITIMIELTNPASSQHSPPIPIVNQKGGAVIQWEYWNGNKWDALETCDNTKALTENGAVSFQIPLLAKKTQVSGFESGWIRARLISGDYGQDANFGFINPDQSGQNFNYHASTLAPPSIKSISVSSYNEIKPIRPDALIIDNDFIYETIDIEKYRVFSPFKVGLTPLKALYLGFKANDQKMLAGRWLDIYFQINHSIDRLSYRGNQDLPTINWQYWNGTVWRSCKVRDETLSLYSTGIVSILVAEDIAGWEQSSLRSESSSGKETSSLYWIRAVLVTGHYEAIPVLQKVLLNTTFASQVTTLNNEILGSGNGTPNQIFYAARSPILENPCLEVREPQLPAEAEQTRIYQEEGSDAITVTRNAQGRIEEIWVRWHEVRDFLNSSNDDRHFVIERLSGEIRFGDGSKGRLLPLGANNIRLQTYKSGGGSLGNKPGNSVTQLRTSVPLVDSVINLEASQGGQDIEDWSSVYSRGSRYLRHRGRAVTPEDYEDLALQGSQQIARAKCFPLLDLTTDSRNNKKPGILSLIVVPQSLQAEPKPSLELLQRIWNFLDQVRDKGASLIILGPEYVRICVEVVIAPKPGAEITSECRKRLENFLHPLTGGENSRGWDFGQLPHQSDFISLLESVSGIEYIKSLQISIQEERPGLLEKGIFLICSGNHQVHMSL